MREAIAMTTVIQILALLSICLTTCLVVGTDGRTPAKESVPSKAESAQAPKFIPVPGKAIGILVTDVKEAMAAEGRHGPAGAAGFAYGPGSYHWIFLPCDAKADQATAVKVHLGTNPLEVKVFENVCPATEELLTRKPLHIKTPYTLVKVTVNDGLGSPSGDDRFVAFDTEVVEGTEAYPLRVTDEVRSREKDYKEYLDGQKEMIGKTMEQLATEVLGKRAPTGPRETNQRAFVTWLPEDERLRIELRTRITDGEFKYGKGIERGPVAKGLPPPKSDKAGTRYGTMFGLEIARVYEVSKRGKLERSESLPLKVFSKEIPPPRGAR
jgi:hypothetical protein